MANSKLITLNKFVTKARKYLGQISIKSLVEERDNAIKVILQALFQNDQSLQLLALECASVVELDSDWLVSSQKFEQAYPVNTLERERLREGIIFLVQHLMYRTLDSTHYRGVLQNLLTTTLDSNRAFYTQLGRDFYAIVVKPLIHQKTSDSPNRLSSLVSSENSALMALWDRIDTEHFNDQEQVAIDAYQQVLNQTTIKIEQLQLRIQLAKVLLMVLRNKSTQKNNLFYRQAVDEIKEGIINPLLTEQFLLVSRQFHPYWKSI
jgi:hypothetical protein